MGYFYICVLIILGMFVLALMKISAQEDYIDEEWLRQFEETRNNGIQVYYPEGKCQPPDGVVIKPDGVNELDPCFYEEIETHYNCTVHVLQCKNCGHIELEWEPQKEWMENEDYYKEK